MSTLSKFIAPLGILFAALGMSAAHADSTSSASSASSTSLGSSSTSLEKSSDSSSKGKDAVAQGQYAVVDMVAVADKPDMLRLRLSPLETTNATAFVLLVPRQTAERAQLAAGQVIAAEHRDYGLAFATLDTAGNTTPFFLVLDDAWYRELESRPVVL